MIKRPYSPDIQFKVTRLLEPEVIRELAAGVPGFDRAGLLAALVEAWGGQDRFARAIFQEFSHAGAGSMTRQRILDMICRMLSQHSNDEHAKPVEEMDDAELRAAILSVVPQIEANVGVRVEPDTPAEPD